MYYKMQFIWLYLFYPLLKHIQSNQEVDSRTRITWISTKIGVLYVNTAETRELNKKYINNDLFHSQGFEI